MGCLPQQTKTLQTFLASFVLLPHGGHRITLGAIVLPSQDFCFTHIKLLSNCNRRAQPQDFHFLSHPTPLICAQHRLNLSDLHHTTPSPLSPPSKIPTTPLLLSPIPLRFPTPTQPLSIPPQPPSNKHTTHKTHTSYPHTQLHTIIHTLWILLLIFFHLNLAFVSQSHSINIQTTQNLCHTPFAFHLQTSITNTTSESDRAIQPPFTPKIPSRQYCTPPLTDVISPTTTPITCPTNPQAPLPPPPPPHLPLDPPSSPDCEETTPNGKNKKRKRCTTRTPQKKRDKEKSPKLPLRLRTYTLPSMIISTLPPRTPHKTFIVSTIIYSPEISTVG